MSDSGYEVRTKWYQLLKYSVVLSAVLIAAVPLGFAFVGMTSTVAIIFIGSLIYGLLYGIFSAVMLYLDAQEIQKADVDWDPSPVLFALGGFFVTGVAVLYYLYKRREYSPVPASSDNWWYGIVVFFVLTVVGFFVLPIVPVRGSMLSQVFGAVSTIVLAISFYYDASHVGTVNDDWNPFSLGYLAAAAIFGLVPLASHFIGAVYLYQRHKYVGTP